VTLTGCVPSLYWIKIQKFSVELYSYVWPLLAFAVRNPEVGSTLMEKIPPVM
jgi:hypothetical protein